MMSIIVSKFGGSSMADADCFRRVREILAPGHRRQFVVLSAPGKRCPSDDKITDLLCAAHRLYACGENGGRPLSEVRKRFEEIIRDLKLDIDPQSLLATLEADVRHSLDLAASRGEYLCAKIFAAYANLPFVDAADLIRFDENGQIMRDEIDRAVQSRTKGLNGAVIPGFYGSMPNGEIKTFSRGGSDISGALIAAALHADFYENWTDVDGLMSVDPALCDGAVCQPTVSYRQMRLLAKAGAHVLHPYCLEPVCEADVPTILKNTFSPQKPGTYISDHVRCRVPCVCEQGGLSAVKVDALEPNARAVAIGLKPEYYYSPAGEQMIALRNSSLGAPVSAVAAFGMPSCMRKLAEERVRPIATLRQDLCMKYLVPPERCRGALRELHKLLLGCC